MRIPLTVGNFYSDRKVVFANFFLRIPSMRVAHALSAVVDSGSPFTSISTRDALAFGIPIKTLDKETVTRLAGFTFYGKNVKGALNFRDEANNVVKFEHDVRILVPTKLDSATIAQVQDIPSLVGTDLMEDERLTFTYNPSALSAYFERNPPEPPSASQAAPVIPHSQPIAQGAVTV
ncbi:MAG: hypothetical protein JRM99_09015 [Nitrososphaerota archaeon]|nr:hypothetical protein [Nitrososphaerota archaeon]